MAVHTQRGKLLVSFFVGSTRVKEYTGLDATAANRKVVERKLTEVTNLIKAKRLTRDDYLAAFPGSPKVDKLFPRTTGTNLTTEQYLTIWMEQRSPFRPDGSVKPNFHIHPETWRHDRHVVELFKKAFGPVPLAELRPQHIKQLRSELELTRKGQTVRKILYLLSGALRAAVEDRLIESSPMPKVQTIKQKPLPRREFTPADREAILAGLPSRLDLIEGGYVSGSTLRDFYAAWFCLGWRDSEIVALKFTDVDHPEQAIHLQRARSPRQNPVNPALRGIEAAPKNGERHVPIGWAPHLVELIKRRERESLAVGRTPYVFYDSRGRPLDQELLGRKVWTPLLRKLGIATDEDVSSRATAQYAIRHSAISGMISVGVPLQVIERIVGTSKKQIFDSYMNTRPQKLDADIAAAYVAKMTTNVSADVSAAASIAPADVANS